MISFAHLSWETAVELCCFPERQPYCDIVENTILFCYTIFMKPKKPHKCDCGSNLPGLCYCNCLASPQLQLLSLVGRLLLPDDSFTANDLLFIHSECRRWRQGALAFLYRWLILRYPEDATPEVLTALSKLWVEVCRVEGIFAEYVQIDETHVELKMSDDQK